MTADLTDAEELAALEAETNERLEKLLAVGVNFAPGLFEQIRLTAYLEHLLIDAGLIQRAKLDYLNRCKSLIENAEAQVPTILENREKARASAAAEELGIFRPPMANRQQRRYPS